MIAGFFFQAFLLHHTTKILFVKNALYKTALKINIYNILINIGVGIAPLILLSMMGLEWLFAIIMMVVSFFILNKLLQKYYKTTFRKNIKIYIIYTILAIVMSVAGRIFFVIPVRYFIVEPFYVKGAAMEPNFENNEYMLINKISYRFNNPERGDIVVFKYPKNPQEYFIKRLIGLPGEKIQLKDGNVIIFNDQNPNGKRLNEPYLPAGTKTWGLSEEPIELTENLYYILGDNRNESKDSRSFGPVNIAYIIGKHWVTPLKK